MNAHVRWSSVVVMFAGVVLSARASAQASDIYTLRRRASGTAPAAATPTVASLAERVLVRRLGEDGFKRVAGRDRADLAKQWNAVGLARDSATLTGRFVPVDRNDVLQRSFLYGSFPGGVNLEGVAAGIGEITIVRFDRRYNAFIVNDRQVYFTPVPANAIAVIAAAFAADENMLIGVSGSGSRLSFGKVPDTSRVFADLQLTDQFLSEFVFAEDNWTNGYRFANDYVLRLDSTTTFSNAASFTFTDFRFSMTATEIRPAAEALETRVTPIARTAAADSGFMPDPEPILQGKTSAAYDANSRHTAENAAYYRRERLVDRMFAYGELAAFLRQVKKSGFDLADLARRIPDGGSAARKEQ